MVLDLLALPPVRPLASIQLVRSFVPFQPNHHSKHRCSCDTMTAAASSSNSNIDAAWQQALQAYSSSSASESSLAGPSTSTSATSSFLQVARARKTIRNFISSYDAVTNHTINGAAPLIPTPVQEAQRLLSTRGLDDDLAKLIDEALVQRVERSARGAVEELQEGELDISSSYDKSICGLFRGLVREKEGLERVREGLGMGR